MKNAVAKKFEPRTRKLSGSTLLLFNTAAALFAGFYLYTAGFGILSTETHRGMYLLFTFVLGFMMYPATRKSPKGRVTYWDCFLIVVAALSMVYWMTTYSSYARYRCSDPNLYDFWFGVIAVIVCLEITRRAIGNLLVALGVIFLVQLYFGRYLPGILAHPGFQWSRIVEFVYSDMQGIFGVVADTFATYIFPYIIFGAFLQKSGGGEFFINLACAATGGWIGGPAKVAVVSSALFGSISGSSVANVVGTGTFTIPVMKRVGYKGEEAGAIESVASTGGQFMPPIMGAGVFLLASFTETPYFRIAMMNVIPALLYFYSVGWNVHLQALKTGALGLPKEEIPDFWKTLSQGWHFAIPLVLIFYFMFRGYSPSLAAFIGCVSTVALSWVRRETRMSARDIWDALAIGGKNSISTGATVGTLGLIMGGIVLGGLGPKFSALLIQLSAGNLLVAVVLVTIVSIILGMGLTTTSSYLVLSVVAAPALMVLGVNQIVAHLVCFYTATISNITPPVCISAFAAAAIAEADPMKTGLNALKYGMFLLVIPFAFVYFPEILTMGAAHDTIYLVASYLLSIPMFAVAVIGYLFGRIGVFERALALVSSVCLFTPGLVTDAVGLAAG
ncbi:MAG: TRAP transporter permease, partial [Firmicutes bacterium]|nr:TRAP transporter permease [Bacillota bacterium]